MYKYVKQTTLIDKITRNEFVITTEGRITFAVKVVHRIKVFRIKKYLSFIDKNSYKRG